MQVGEGHKCKTEKHSWFAAHKHGIELLKMQIEYTPPVQFKVILRNCFPISTFYCFSNVQFLLTF